MRPVSTPTGFRGVFGELEPAPVRVLVGLRDWGFALGLSSHRDSSLPRGPQGGQEHSSCPRCNPDPRSHKPQNHMAKPKVKGKGVGPP